MTNSLLLLGEALFYFGSMAVLFRLRRTIGIGVFMCAVGVMHFLETYLASAFYVELPFGMVSPGSAVLFSGKLVMLLLLYIKEDALTVRQPIYGLLFGNSLMIGLVLLLRLHEVSPLPDGQTPDIGFVDQMGWLMVWGTTLLYVDAILIILLYEKLGRTLRHVRFLRVLASVAAILTFDQVGFFTALHYVAGAPLEVFFGGWAAKMAAAVVFSALLCAYLNLFETRDEARPREIADIFHALTFRERYEALVEQAGRDSLTGLLHRGRFEDSGRERVARSLQDGRPLSLLIVDADHFKSINDRFGHAEGDRVLKMVADELRRAVEADDQVFRIGGEEFAILSPYPHAVARLLAENIRERIRLAGITPGLSVSIGIASLDERHGGLAALFALADERLYAAKAAGRDRVVGQAPAGQKAAGEAQPGADRRRAPHG